MKFYLLVLFAVFFFSVAQAQVAIPATTNNAIASPIQLDTLIENQQENKKMLPSSKLKERSSKDSEEMQAKQLYYFSSLFTRSKQQSSTQRTQRSPTAFQQEQMNQAVSFYKKNAPASFEHHLFYYLAGNHSVERISYLLNAEALRPEDATVQAQLAAYYCITKDDQKAHVYLQKLKESAQLSQPAIDYAQDLMQSVTVNGTLITHGFDDTYGALYWQLTQGFRTDVRIISLDFLQSAFYQKQLISEGYNLLKSTQIDVAYLHHICVNNEMKNIGISMTTPKEYLTDIQQSLYAVGLVFEYHSTPNTANFPRNEILWNSSLTKKVLQYTSPKAIQLTANYLPMLLVLRTKYHEQQQKEAFNAIDSAMDGIAKRCNKSAQLQHIKEGD